MVAKVGPSEYHMSIRFGGGLHTRASEDDIDPREAADGNNFLLDLENRELKRRPPFDLVGTAPNAAEIRGGGSLLKTDGTAAAFFQAGANVYQWDGSDFQASPVLDTVSATARLRGHWRSHVWPLSDKLLITDLELEEVIKEWDGSATFADVAFLSGVSASFGTFFAKYLKIANERAIFGHVKDASATSRHMIVGSQRSDYTRISVSDRPSSSLSEEDPFFLLTPDLRPINGLTEAFGTFIISTEQGQIFALSGASAMDFAISDFYPGSGAAGEESLAYIGTDIVYGRPGRVESVRDTDRFGDSEADDLTRQIATTIKDYTGWQIVYNSRLNRVYMFPDGQSEVWVFQTAMLGGEVSPFMRWTTSHDLAFQPTFAASMLDPDDGLEYVFMGDASGNVYRLEGTGESGDGGANAIETSFLTRVFEIDEPPDQEIFDVQGFVKYRKDAAFSIELVFEWSGVNIFNETVTVTVPAADGGSYYGGSVYYGGDYYYGSISGRLSRQNFKVPGQGNAFQVRVKVTGNETFAISEISLRLRAAG